ncbi:MAG TPA: CBS domain-containing protein [Bacillota bacterium]|nr:CBS domain-containing protein [Bacillota bacterium]
MQLLVRDVMTRNIIKLKKTTTIGEAAQIFLDRSIDGAPIIDDKNRVTGIFTKTHLIRAMAIGTPLNIQVDKVMSRNIITINEKMLAEEALSIPVGRLPVVDDQGNLVGWLTRTDLANAFSAAIKPLMEGLLPALNRTGVALVSVDSEGIINIYNQATEVVLGITPGSTMIGQPMEVILPGQMMAQVLETGKPTSEILYLNNRTYAAQYSPIITDEQVTGGVAIYQDITGLVK